MMHVPITDTAHPEAVVLAGDTAELVSIGAIASRDLAASDESGYLRTRGGH